MSTVEFTVHFATSRTVQLAEKEDSSKLVLNLFAQIKNLQILNIVHYMVSAFASDANKVTLLNTEQEEVPNTVYSLRTQSKGVS